MTDFDDITFSLSPYGHTRGLANIISFGHPPAPQKRSSLTDEDDGDYPFKRPRTGDVLPDKSPLLPTGRELLASLTVFWASLMLLLPISSFRSCVTSIYYICPLSVPAPCLNNVLSPSSSDFAHLAEMGLFVDKSPALLDFLEVPVPIHVLLRPRRSGKTTLLRMFR